jgi:hypothetical protein
MFRSAANKVMWVGRATAFLVGLAVILALVLGAASVALGANGDYFKVGKSNLASAVSTLTKSGAGPALRLNVDSGPPLAVNSNGKVANLNADKLDGLDSSALRTRCPAGTQSLGGGCIENTVRGTDRLSDASSTCAGLGRRLPTAASPSAAANT